MHSAFYFGFRGASRYYSKMRSEVQLGIIQIKYVRVSMKNNQSQTTIDKCSSTYYFYFFAEVQLGINQITIILFSVI
ncbi:unnamed protein product [Rotaria socialis]